MAIRAPDGANKAGTLPNRKEIVHKWRCPAQMNFMSAIQIEGTVGAFCWERASENIHIDKNICASSKLLKYGNTLHILYSKVFFSTY